MPSSTAILVHNLLAMAAALALVGLLAFFLARLVRFALRPLLARVDPSGVVSRRWHGQLARVLLLVVLALGLAMLGGVALATWYERDLSHDLRAWAGAAVFADPAAFAWRLLELLGVVVAAPALYYLLSGLVRLVLDALASIPGVARCEAQLDLLRARVQTMLRWCIGLGAMLVALQMFALSDGAMYPFHLVAFSGMGLTCAVAAVAAVHLAIDLMLELSSALAARRTSLRLLARLNGLAGVTKRAFDYLIYVGVATIVSHQITPDTWLAAWGLVAIRVIAILYVSRVIVELCVVLLREVLLGDGKITDPTALQQRQTLIPVATSLLRYVVSIISIAMVLGELGLDTTPLLAAAGLLGIAVGLGAQAIVSDLVSGFFILFEGLYFVGHRVQIGDAIGFVEEIGVRVSRIRDGAGAVHCIPNGEVRSVISFSQQFVNAVVEFGVPYEEDLPRVFAAIEARCVAVRARHDDIVSNTQIVVEQLRESCVWLKAVTRVRPGVDDEMSEILRAEIAAALRDAAVAPPHPRRLLLGEARTAANSTQESGR